MKFISIVHIWHLVTLSTRQSMNFEPGVHLHITNTLSIATVLDVSL